MVSLLLGSKLLSPLLVRTFSELQDFFSLSLTLYNYLLFFLSSIGAPQQPQQQGFSFGAAPAAQGGFGAPAAPVQGGFGAFGAAAPAAAPGFGATGGAEDFECKPAPSGNTDSVSLVT